MAKKINSKFRPIRRRCVACKKKRVSPKHHKYCEKCWEKMQNIKNKNKLYRK